MKQSCSRKEPQVLQILALYHFIGKFLSSVYNGSTDTKDLYCVFKIRLFLEPSTNALNKRVSGLSPFTLYRQKENETKMVQWRRWQNRMVVVVVVVVLGGGKRRCQISRLFHAAEFISQGGYVRFVIAKLWCTSRLSPEANRTVAVRLSGQILEPVSYDYYTPTHTHMA